MDVRTQVRSAAAASGGSPSPRRGSAACAWPTDFLHWTSVLRTGPAMTTRSTPVRVPLHARESHLHMLAHTGCRVVVAFIVA
jgi:hypothetical protein